MAIPNSLSKLIHITNVELKKGFNNRAVFGGIEKYTNQWISEAHEDKIPDGLIEEISQYLLNYSNPDLSQRKIILRMIREAIKQYLNNRGYPENMPNPNPEPDGIHPVEEHPTNYFPKNTRGGLSEVHTSQSQNSEKKSGLDAPITVMKGIGPAKSKNLKTLGINTIEDLLHYYPRRYDDYSQLKPINRLTYQEEITVIGSIYKAEFFPAVGRKKGRIEAIVTDGTGFLRVNWYPGKYSGFLINKLKPNLSIVLSGKIDVFHGRLVMNSPEWEPLDKNHLNTNRIVPVYPLTAGITQRNIRDLTFQIVSYWSEKIQDFLPHDIKNAVQLLDLDKALQQVHYPDNMETLQRSQFRLAFDEIFLLQLGVLKQKSYWKSKPAEKFSHL